MSIANKPNTFSFFEAISLKIYAAILFFYEFIFDVLQGFLIKMGFDF